MRTLFGVSALGLVVTFAVAIDPLGFWPDAMSGVVLMAAAVVLALLALGSGATLLHRMQ